MFSLSYDVGLLCKGYHLLYDTLTSTSKVIVGTEEQFWGVLWAVLNGARSSNEGKAV